LKKEFSRLKTLEIMALLMQLLRSYVLISDMLCSARSNGLNFFCQLRAALSGEKKKKKEKDQLNYSRDFSLDVTLDDPRELGARE